MKDKNRYVCVIVTALIQGLLLGIYAVIREGVMLCLPISVILLVPFAFWLSQEHWGRRLFNLIAGLTAVLMLSWAYRMWSINSADIGLYYVPSQKGELMRLSMAVFFLMPFFQCRIATWSWRIPYSEIFFQFCRNVFLLFQASIVIVVFWGLLVTAGLLFELVGLTGIPLLLFNPVIALPLTSVTIAISITVAIKHPGIDSLGRWLLSVFAWLLPFFSVLSIIFVIYLPFSGLQRLWSTGQASTLIILLQFGTIILANAAWLDGNKTAFENKYVNILAQSSLLCLPVYTGLSIYSVSLRIMQYGLTVDRVHAMFLVVITGIWGIGYSVALLMKHWPSWIGRVNMTAIMILAIITSAMNSPLLDPFRLASQNQLSRLQSGEILPEDFDYIYTRFNLGRYGSHVLSELSKSESSRVRQGVESALSVTPQEYLASVRNDMPVKRQREDIIMNAKVYPEGRKLTSGQKEYLVSHWREIQNIKRSNEIVFVFMNVSSSGDQHNLLAITRETGIIYTIYGESLVKSGQISGEFGPMETVRDSMIRTVEPQYKDIVIGERVYHVFSE